MYAGMARLSTDRIAVFQFIYPTIAIVIDWLFYEQRLGNVQLSGIALMAVAVWFAERVPRQHRVLPLMPGNTALEPVGNPFKPKQDRITIGRYQSTPDVPRTASSVECLLLAGSGRMPGASLSLPRSWTTLPSPGRRSRRLRARRSERRRPRMSRSVSRKSRLTPFSVCTAQNGRNRTGAERPRIRDRKVADARQSRAYTMMRSRCTAMSTPFPNRRCASQMLITRRCKLLLHSEKWTMLDSTNVVTRLDDCQLTRRPP